MEPPLCTAAFDVEEKVLVATITVGEIREAAVAYDLRNEMLALLEAAGAEHLVIDARTLVVMGSVGFLAFLGVRREFAGRIVLCNLSQPIRESFTLCRLIQDKSDRLAPFEAADTLEDALQLLSASR